MMASSYMSFSLLAKGIGHVTKNGHEKLDVILEPEDYYNLQSTYESELNAFQRKPRDLDGQKVEEIPLHKTFITRKGALLLFSEDLAKKGQWEEATQRRKVRNKKELSWMTPFDASTLEHAGEDILKTCHDLSWAILSYGNKPEYRKRGEELYLRFVHQNNAGNKEQRKIRPGFSPKRYISTWSHQWDNDLVEKLISKGMIADKTLFTQNPHQLTGKFTNFNLSDRPTPYRVTQNMLVGSTTQPGYEFYSFGDSLGGDELKISSTPPPSQDDTPRGDMEDIDDDEDVIQALKYHENGTIQQVEYSELQPKEKESILAELLVAAHEHQQNIRNTLTMISEDPSDGASESGSSKTELVMDMNEAIMSLIASPVKQQMMERKQLQQQQEEQEELDLLKKREKLVNERMKSSKEVDDKNDPDYGMTFSHTNKPSELEPITSRPSKKGPLKRGGNARKLEVSDEELMTSYMNEQAAGGTSEEPTSTKMAPPPYKEKKDSLTSSVNKPVLFQPPISMNDKPKYSSSNTSSKRRGAMPISSNIVRQTLAGNLSILSASTQHQPNYDIDVRNIAEQISVPLPSIPEPNRQHGKIPSPFSTLGNQPQHTSNNTGNLPPTRRDVDDDRPQNSDHPEQHRRQNQQDKIDGDQDDDRDDPDQIDPSALKSSLRGSTKSSQSSKLSQTRSRGLRTKLVPALPEKRYLHVEIPFHGMKGGRGPGSQSSSSLIKSNGEPKKTESRNVLPQMKKHHQQQQHNYASVRMPDGEIMSIGGSITQSISTKNDSHHDYDYYNEDKSSTLLGSDERKRIIRSSNIKSEVSSSHEGGSSTKRRVSFMEERKVMEIGRNEDENDETHHSMSGSRPTSSVSSEKIIKHAKKVAAIVVNQQRPTSRLDDDARKAAQVWNEVIVSDDEEDDVNEDDETAADTHDDDDGDDFNEDEEGYLLKAANKNTSKRNSVRSLASNTSSHHRRADDDDEDEGSTSRQTLHVDLQDKFGAESESSAMSTARDDASSKYTANTKVSVQAVDVSNSGTTRKPDVSAKGKNDLLKDLTSNKHEGNSPASKPSKSKKPASSKSKASSKSSESKKKHKRKEKKEQQPTTATAESVAADSPTFPVDSNTAEDSDFSPREDSKTRKEKKRSRKKDPETQVEKLLEGSDHSSKESDGNESKRKASGASTRTPSEAFPSPAQTPVDDYEFVRVEEEFEDEEEEERGVMRERYDTKTDQILKPPGKRSPTAQEDEEDEGSVGGRSEESKAKMIAAKEERMAKRAAAADRRRMEVERKRREKDELQRKKQEEQERKEQMQEQLELERRQREEDLRKKKEEAELEKLKEQEEEEARKRRAEQQAEREKRMEEEKRKKREELQRKRKEEEEKRKEMLRIQEEEEAERKKQEEEMLAQMEEEERIQYQEKMKKEKEEKERLELERRLKEEEEVRKAMEYARKQAILKAHEQAILQQKLEFVRNMKDEGEKLTQAQKISRAYNFSYFELLRLLGMDMPA